jgi:hypothetical protein
VRVLLALVAAAVLTGVASAASADRVVISPGSVLALTRSGSDVAFLSGPYDGQWRPSSAAGAATSSPRAASCSRPTRSGRGPSRSSRSAAEGSSCSFRVGEAEGYRVGSLAWVTVAALISPPR